LMARERGLTVDVAGFNQLMEEQKARARAAQKKQVIELSQVETTAPTQFVGYDKLEASAKVIEVIGVKDKDYGERLCACIVAQPGSDAPDVAQMGRHLQAYGMAKFKWPERIEVLPALPQTAVGKLDKGALRDRFAGRTEA